MYMSSEDPHTGLSQPWLFDDAISTKISCAGTYDVMFCVLFYALPFEPLSYSILSTVFFQFYSMVQRIVTKTCPIIITADNY